MAGSGGGLGSEPASGQEGVFPWLRSLPVAPEYYPTLTEFQDPIGYIFKIEKEASKYGICKVIPPVLASPKKTALANLNRSLAGVRGEAAFTTRQQQIGFCPRRPRAPVQRPVWESGERYTYQEFEAKARLFERTYLKRHSKKGVEKAASLSPLEIETLYWKATADKPFSVEYANDMPGSAFPHARRSGGATVGESAWNMRGVSRAKGSLLRFMKEEIPGVTSPMVYIAMLFSWFAWHVEDHDLHSLNYLHAGASKTWYGVPWEAASAFEEVVRVHGYSGEINPLVMFAVLGEKTTVMSPEVIIGAGVPCCRLVQNPGEFVVTFPRAYHSGFSHGFNLGEAANIATPGWLTLAKDAAIRRASINYPPMVSHFQLLYDLALELYTSIPMSINSKPRSSRLKDKQRGDGEKLVKEQFMKNIRKNNDLLQALGKGTSVVLLPHSSVDISICSNLRVGSQPGVLRFASGLESHDLTGSRDDETDQMAGYFDAKHNLTDNECTNSSGKFSSLSNEKPNRRVFSCVKCGILCFDCVAVLQPREAAARYIMSADCISLNDWITGSGPFVDAEKWTRSTSHEGFDSVGSQAIDIPRGVKTGKSQTALNLLAMTYGNSSDSEEQDEADRSASDDESEKPHCSVQDVCNLKHVSSLRSVELHQEHKSSPDNSNFDADNAADYPFSALGLTKNWALKAIDSTGIPMLGNCDDECSRMHVFCLEHAVEVEQQLRQLGGAHVWLFCHPEYPRIEDEARTASEDPEVDNHWNHIHFTVATPDEEKLFQLALDSEESEPVNSDWAVKLGIHLFYSAKLSWSPLYSKQMPYNSVIYDAFGRSSPVGSPTKSKRSGKLKKVVAGKWCGKVWMSNQVHPFLIKWDSEEAEPEQEQERNIRASPDDKFEKKKMVGKKFGGKRKLNEEGRPMKKFKFLPVKSDDSYDTTDEILFKRYLRTLSLKKGKRNLYDSDDEISDESREDSPTAYRESSVSNDSLDEDRARKKVIAVEGLSDDSSDEDSRPRAGKYRTRKVEKCDDEDASDDSIESSSYLRDIRRCKKSANRSHGKHNKFSVRKLNGSIGVEDEFSVDLVLDGASKKKRTKFRVREEESADECTLQRRKPFLFLKSKRSEFVEHEDNVSDDSAGYRRYQRRRMLKSLKTTADHSEEEGYRLPRNANKSKEKLYVENDIRHMNKASRSRQARYLRVEEVDSDNSFENESKSMPIRKIKRKTCRMLMKKVTRQLINEDESKDGPSTRLRTQRKDIKTILAQKSGKTKFEDAEHQCDMEGCTMSFNTKQELALHKRNICPVKGCVKKFFSHKYLVQHRRVHLDDRPLKCPWKGCKMTFKWAWARTEHIRIHTGVRPYVCGEEGCGQTFRFVSDFSRHKRKTGHSGKKTGSHSSKV